MPEISGQSTIFGRVVAQNKISLPGLGEVDYILPDDLPRDLEPGDQVRVVVTYGIEHFKAGAPLNKQLVGKKPFGVTWLCTAEVPQCVEFEQVALREDLDKIWDQAHGATG